MSEPHSSKVRARVRGNDTTGKATTASPGTHDPENQFEFPFTGDLPPAPSALPPSQGVEISSLSAPGRSHRLGTAEDGHGFPDSSASPSKDDIAGLIEKAEEIFTRSKATEGKLLSQRIELGRVLNELKREVGHGNFDASFSKWVREGKLHFSLKTGQRAMAYAKLEAEGKFAGGAGNDRVANLADAERLRLDRAKQAKLEKMKKEEADRKANGEMSAVTEGKRLPSLPESQVSAKAKGLVAPLLGACDGYDGETRRALLEELIELLTEEIERCS